MHKLLALITERFGDTLSAPPEGVDGVAVLEAMAERRSFRRFTGEPVSLELIKLLAAVALSAPSKSDLQQRDIIIVKDPEVRGRLNAVLASQGWIAKAPELLVFCANNRRQRQVHGWRQRPFVNDHLDAFFNASVDAGIALQAFVTAAEAAGLGCCPISAIRNESAEVSDALGLPDHVFAVAGLGLGWPQRGKPLSLRLPLSATVHVDRFDEARIEADVAAYDVRRAEVQPMGDQRSVEEFGTADVYTWSEDKARQYAKPERAKFGAFIKAKGFKLV